ncbi:MAG: UDP-N-acetylglucosamine--N-acetylmuramyl-(pentapeptide) pyrophosphoryl-undecaprenol N-acetylglucosamine transferase [Chloroflexi bacterium]|nr:MAG: UDP-N-acetylglucosamine--N-acetylmuramyl-(pentapeptide) pyrophosphoryl-undecaprenol N-acetylglucosamine transferase [Chloroflexota bacterium]
MDVVYIGSSGGMERNLLPATGVRSFLFPMAAPHSAGGILSLLVATLRSVVVLCRTRPRATFATGGYVSVPAVVASWMLRIPIVIFLPDVVPGRAVSWLLPLARRIAASTEETLRYLPAVKTEVTGYPVREFFAHASPREARQRMGLPAHERVLCVYGASQGARAINRALARSLPELLTDSNVVHICGEQRLEEARNAAADLSPAQRERYHLFAYLHDEAMADALAAADLVVCRSGASTVGELPVLGKPSILVPLPERKVHQYDNAEYLERRGAAVIVDEATLDDVLVPTIRALLGNETRLAGMAGAARSLARPDAAQQIARLLRETAA